eukprot:5640888-Prorocentrum_lima.AAC.1
MVTATVPRELLALCDGGHDAGEGASTLPPPMATAAAEELATKDEDDEGAEDEGDEGAEQGEIILPA